ncbi:unnamed protein product [Meganyctiphanes norvegica]|uniref:C-type lectin domain-containing protein n=1 Tax=Meganyctiphanes norvegica TaxID=48144 RepID=A0AAV2R150_MEGNR
MKNMWIMCWIILALVMLLTHTHGQGCPPGFIKSPGSATCYKMFLEEVSPAAAKKKCASEGLVLAQPSDAEVVALRDVIVDTYDGVWVAAAWVAATGDENGQYFWSRDDTTVPQKLFSPWFLVYSGAKCLALLLDADSGRAPQQPYGPSYCAETNSVLCQGKP